MYWGKEKGPTFIDLLPPLSAFQPLYKFSRAVFAIRFIGSVLVGNISNCEWPGLFFLVDLGLMCAWLSAELSIQISQAMNFMS